MTYTVYKTVNQVNGKFYIGVHKTNNPMDEYLGSGTVIQLAIQKYGVLSFVKEILFKYETQEEAWAKENELVELHRADPLCYNLRKGGSGGFDYLNKTGKSRSVDHFKQATRVRVLRLKSDPEYRKKYGRNISISLRKKGGSWVPADTILRNQKLATSSWSGSHHTPESRERIREGHLGDSNTFSGRKWMTHPLLGNRPVKRENIELHLEQGWKFGRTVSCVSPAETTTLER